MIILKTDRREEWKAIPRIANREFELKNSVIDNRERKKFYTTYKMKTMGKAINKRIKG